MATARPDSGNAVLRTEEARPWPWWGEEVQGLEDLTERIRSAETIEDWSRILRDHLRWGNTKIADSVAIFNLNAAHDCPNLATDNCQVDPDECYAVHSEKAFPNALSFRRRQEYLWDHLDAQTFAEAFEEVLERKRKPVDAFRVNQSGDVRHRGDIVKLDRIAGLVSVLVYLYSASDYLDWDGVEHLTVNQSNAFADYGHRHFTALPHGVDSEDVEWLDDNAVQCPYDAHDKRIKCGECRLCINPDGPDVYIRLH